MTSAKWLADHPFAGASLLLAAGFAAISIIFGSDAQYDTLNFVPVTYDAVVDLLTPILLIALFVERALEVFVATGRKLERTERDTAINKKKAASTRVAFLAYQTQIGPSIPRNKKIKRSSTRSPAPSYGPMEMRLTFGTTSTIVTSINNTSEDFGSSLVRVRSMASYKSY